jgi:hypothetical protein
MNDMIIFSRLVMVLGICVSIHLRVATMIKRRTVARNISVDGQPQVKVVRSSTIDSNMENNSLFKKSTATTNLIQEAYNHISLSRAYRNPMIHMTP